MRFLFPALIICSQAFAQPANFPLHVGDRWQYYSIPDPGFPPSGYSLRVAGDTLMPDGNSYAVIVGDDGLPTDFMRQSGDSVFEYRVELKRGFVFFDYSRLAGDTVSSTPFGNDTMDILSVSIGSSMIFGRQLRNWSFAVDRARHMSDDEYGITVIDSLGVSRRRPSFGDEYNLTGAVIDGRIFGTIASVRPGAAPVPDAPSLYQNYPNPFNPSTVIPYYLPVRSRVKLVVYSLRGQVVASLVDGVQAPGFHEAVFSGAGLASGSYFYSLQAGARRFTRVFVLIR